MDGLLDGLRKLTAIPAPSGREGLMVKAMRARWGEFGRVNSDRLGNLHVTIGKGSPHVAFVAHMDEVGFVVRVIRDDGFIGLNRLGGIPERVLIGQRIILLGRNGPIDGVFATFPHHLTPESEKYRVPPIGEIWVDIGAHSNTDVEGLGIRVGDFAVYYRSWHFSGDSIFANALDDRVGLTAMTEMLEHGNIPEEGQISFVASVQEEFSVRGLVPTIRSLNPDALVVVDICPATDIPVMTDHSNIRIGCGPVLNLHSFHGRGTLGGVLPPEWLVEATELAAQMSNVSLQRASVVGVITDGAFAIHLNDGIPTIEVGVPVRYTHCPIEVCSLHDLKEFVKLLASMASSICEGISRNNSTETNVS